MLREVERFSLKGTQVSQINLYVWVMGIKESTPILCETKHELLHQSGMMSINLYTVFH